MMTGENQGYWWLESRDGFLSDLTRLCPSLFVGRHVHITSLDSGPLKCSPDELAAGWIQRNDVAISPKLDSVDILPCFDYSEWYVYDRPEMLSDHQTFESISTFSLIDPEHLLKDADPTWDMVGIRKEVDYRRTLQERFWEQLCRLKPLAYIAEGDHLIVATTDREAFNCMSKGLSSA